MDKNDFEGTLVLEKLAEINMVDEFLELVDSDDFKGAATLMKKAKVDNETIKFVLERMRNSDGDH